MALAHSRTHPPPPQLPIYGCAPVAAGSEHESPSLAFLVAPQIGYGPKCSVAEAPGSAEPYQCAAVFPGQAHHRSVGVAVEQITGLGHPGFQRLGGSSGRADGSSRKTDETSIAEPAPLTILWRSHAQKPQRPYSGLRYAPVAAICH